MPMDSDELLREVITECLEHVQSMESILLSIERNTGSVDNEAINTLFRSAHSIKGAAGFCGLKSITALAHSFENVLNAYRYGDIRPEPSSVDILLSANDYLKTLLEDPKGGELLDVSSHIGQLDRILEAECKEERAALADLAPSDLESQADSILEASLEVEATPPAGDDTAADDPLPLPEDTAEKGPAPVPASQSQNSLRVNVSVLDRLMNLAGELVLSRNQLLQVAGQTPASTLSPVTQRIDSITSDLQAEIMKTRMQELAAVFNKLPRLVRDLSRSLGKQVDLRIEGREVELDKAIIEALSDPLVHIVRNALDHGIEKAGIRRSQGKDAAGRLAVRAYHDAGQVNIEISDDGAGINIDRLKAKAVKMGLMDASTAEGLSERAALDLVFHPGLSTAGQVSEVSGRGVGMDVVRSNLEKLGGAIEVRSVPGKGTTNKIKLPLTMAIIPCLTVRLGRMERYAIPQINLVELVRVRNQEVTERLERIGDAEVLRLRGDLLPVLRLGEVLQAPGYFRDPVENELKKDRRSTIADRRTPIGDDEEVDEVVLRRSGVDRRRALGAMNILVLNTGDFEYGLIVDELEDTEEIVVKPLGRHFKHVKAYAGATIMGDGQVAPILDVSGLAEQAGLYRQGEVINKGLMSDGYMDEDDHTSDSERILVFTHGSKEFFGVPIPLVARIEGADPARIESSLGHLSIQYRGGSLRLIRLDRHLPIEPLPETDRIFIIVFEIGGKEIGLIAAGLVDERLELFDVQADPHKRPGVMGSMILDGRTVMILDIFELVEMEEPTWRSETAAGLRHRRPRVLLAEDSEFFREKVGDYLRGAGYEVLAVVNGREALDALETETVDLVLTDIEMPVMDGYELVRQIRGHPRWSNLKVLALTSLAGRDDIERGLSAGLDRYLIKLDRDQLIDTLNEMMPKTG